MKRLSIIIPTLNEARLLPRLLASLTLLGFLEPEIIVVDGGSTDGTCRTAKDAGAVVVEHTPGRGGQLRRGAAIASGEFLLFLHGDSVLTPEAVETVRRETIERSFRIGVFRLRFDVRRPVYRLYSFFSRIDSRWTTFGDQGVLIARALYDSVGGFPDQPLLEDVEFFRRVRMECRIVKFSSGIVTSARRFEANGPIRTQWRNLKMLIDYHCGGSVETLAERYRMEGQGIEENKNRAKGAGWNRESARIHGATGQRQGSKKIPFRDVLEEAGRL